MPQTETAWHLDKKVPITLIFAIVLQTFGIGYWVAGIASHVEALSVANDKEDARIQMVEQVTQSQAVSSAAVGAQISSVKDTLTQVREDQRAQLEMLRQILEAKR